jgi:hypothetical protein
MRIVVAGASLFLLQAVVGAQEGGGDMKERVAALQKAVQTSVQQSSAVLKQHEWIETTRVSVKGEVKSTLMNRCYYGAEGNVQKIPVTPPQDGKEKEKLTAYMRKAVGLVDRYVPPEASRIQQALAAGRTAVQILEPGKRVRRGFPDYLLPGDELSVDVDVATGHLLGIQVSTYVDTPKDPVGLTLTLATFPDGTSYPARINLDVKAKQIVVTVENSGYRKVS